jgi:hypothetical protein
VRLLKKKTSFDFLFFKKKPIILQQQQQWDGSTEIEPELSDIRTS